MNNEILDILWDKTRDFIVLFISTVLDCIESAFDCMTYSKGKSLKNVLFVVYSFIPMTILPELFGFNAFIHWQDAIIASLIMTVIFSINNITKANVENSIIFARDVAVKAERKIREKGGQLKKCK